MEQAAAPRAAAEPLATTNLIVVSAPETEAASSAVFSAGPEDALTLPVQYACQNGTGFSAIFPTDGRSVIVTIKGVTRTLDLVEGADTPFYRRNGVQLAADGASAALTGAGQDYSGCVAG